MRMMGATTHGITISATSPGVAEAQKNSIISAAGRSYRTDLMSLNIFVRIRKQSRKEAS